MALCLQLKHAEVQSQCKEHKGRLQRLQNTYFLLRTACDKRMSDLHRIDRSLEESVNARSLALPLFASMLTMTSVRPGSSWSRTPTSFALSHTAYMSWVLSQIADELQMAPQARL